ncbi:hypothetical protein V8F20_010194 [Naviculisporaceae sp. PSN 640]
MAQPETLKCCARRFFEATAFVREVLQGHLGTSFHLCKSRKDSRSTPTREVTIDSVRYFRFALLACTYLLLIFHQYVIGKLNLPFLAPLVRFELLKCLDSRVSTTINGAASYAPL